MIQYRKQITPRSRNMRMVVLIFPLLLAVMQDKVSNHVPVVKDNISTWRLFFNKTEIANSNNPFQGKLMTIELQPKTFTPSDTLYFTWQMDVIIDDTLKIDLYLGKEPTSSVRVSEEKSTGFYAGKFAASRLRQIADSLSTTNLFLHFSITHSKPRSILKIKLKD